MNWLYDGNHLAWVGRQTGLGVCRARTATGQTLGEGSLVGITLGCFVFAVGGFKHPVLGTSWDGGEGGGC